MAESIGRVSATQPLPRGGSNSSAQRGLSKVLVVDDSELLSDMLAMVLQLDGFAARGVYGGAQAMAACDEDVPDIAFIDIAMPDVDGLEVARHFRCTHGDKQVILVALTGWGDDTVKEHAKLAGFDFFMVKPLDPTSIRKFLSRLVCEQLASCDGESEGSLPDAPG